MDQYVEMNEAPPVEEVEASIERLTKDLRLAARRLNLVEARYLVDVYYQVQDQRIRNDHQMRTLAEAGEPNDMFKWLGRQNEKLEAQIKGALDNFSKFHPDGEYLRNVRGIGPVIAAGLIAHCGEQNLKETVGPWWRFAGMDPTVKWKKGEKRPWNAGLKTLLWKLGEGWVKLQGHPECHYGHMFADRKRFEWARNERGDYSAKALEKAPLFDDTTQTKLFLLGKISPTITKKHRDEGTPIPVSLKATNIGDEIPMFCPGHIHNRARRWTVKLFMAHYHHKVYERVNGKAPPLPYPIAILGHADYIHPDRLGAK